MISLYPWWNGPTKNKKLFFFFFFLKHRLSEWLALHLWPECESGCSVGLMVSVSRPFVTLTLYLCIERENNRRAKINHSNTESLSFHIWLLSHPWHSAEQLTSAGRRGAIRSPHNSIFKMTHYCHNSLRVFHQLVNEDDRKKEMNPNTLMFQWSYRFGV